MFGVIAQGLEMHNTLNPRQQIENSYNIITIGILSEENGPFSHSMSGDGWHYVQDSPIILMWLWLTELFVKLYF